MNLVKTTTSGIYNLLLGLAVTVKHLLKRAVTLQYPDERWEMPERSRGTIVLLSDPETGKLNCNACMLCSKACPVAAIDIERVKNPETKKFEPTSFDIDSTICCYCGLCEQACNFAAIKLTGKYEFSVRNKAELQYNMSFLQEVGRDVKYEKKKRAVKKAPAKPEAKTEEKPAMPEVKDKPDEKPQAGGSEGSGDTEENKKDE